MTTFLAWLEGSKKALVALVIAVLGAAITAAPDGYTQVEILTIVLAGVVALAGVWGIRNTGPLAPGVPPAADPYEQQEVDLRDEAGHGSSTLLTVAAVLVIVVCLVLLLRWLL